MTTPTLSGSEAWVIRKEGENRIQVMEIIFLRAVTGHIREHKIRNESIRDELQIYSIEDKSEKT
jgi:hypothetical protein